MYKELKILIDTFDYEQRKYLARELQNLGGSDSQAICNHLHFLRYGELGQFNPFNNRSYKQLVTDVADYADIDWTKLVANKSWGELTTKEIEDAVIKKLFEDIWSKLSDEEKTKVINKLKDDGQVDLGKILAAGGGLVAANLGGFQVYILSSTILSALSGAIGFTFPFAIYVGGSKAIALAIGPAGWAALAVGSVYQLSKPKWNKLTRALVIISIFRNAPNKDQV